MNIPIHILGNYYVADFEIGNLVHRLQLIDFIFLWALVISRVSKTCRRCCVIIFPFIIQLMKRLDLLESLEIT